VHEGKYKKPVNRPVTTVFARTISSTDFFLTMGANRIVPGSSVIMIELIPEEKITAIERSKADLSPRHAVSDVVYAHIPILS